MQLPLPGEEPEDQAEPPGAAAASASPAPRPAASAEDEHQDQEDEHQEAEEGQLVLVPGGRPPRGTVPAQVWAQMLDHAPTRQRYASRIWADPAPDGCWWWTGALSSTGHGKLRAGPRSIVVSAHVLGWQLHRGLIAARPGEDPVVAHRCDEAACQRPDHWELIERTANGHDYYARRWRAEGPLADVRGAAGRAAAVRAAILAAQAHGADDEEIRAAVRAAQAAGLTRSPRLF